MPEIIRNRIRRHHNLLTSVAAITDPITKGKGGGNTSGKGHGKTSGASDAFFSNVKLLVGADTAVVDESSVARAVTTVGVAFRNTTNPKFGAGCLDPNNTGSFTCANSADFQFGSGDFTVEGWLYTAIADPIIRFGGATGTQRSWVLDAIGGKLRALLSTDGASFGTIMSSGVATINNSTYHHFVLERSGTIVRTYVDGAMDQKVTGFAGTLFASTDVLTIGDGLTGQLDEIRITKGTARYNSDAGYTVPMAAFPRA